MLILVQLVRLTVLTLALNNADLEVKPAKAAGLAPSLADLLILSLSARRAMCHRV